MRTEGERITATEEQIKDLRRDLEERASEERNIRRRLHDLEGIVGTLVDHLKEARRAEERQYRRLELRLQGVLVAITLAGIITPVALIIVHAG